jgi:hypothetical protein
MHIRALEPVSYGILCIDRLLQHADLEETAVVVVVWQDTCDGVEPCVSTRVVYSYGAVELDVSEVCVYMWRWSLESRKKTYFCT